MKLPQARAILRLEWGSILCISVFSALFFGIALWWVIPEQWMTRLQFSPLDSFMGTAMFFGAFLLFPGPWSLGWNGRNQSNGNEFAFSQPISRRQLFWIRSGIFLLGCLVAPAILWMHSYTLPAMELRQPYQPKDRSEMKQFYLRNFPGAELKKTTDGEVIVLPKGAVERSLFRLFVTAACLLLMQLFAVFAMEKRWGGFALGAVIIVWPVCLGALSFGRAIPSFYEFGVALVANHALLIALLGSVLFLGVQRVCERRFCRTEIV